MNTQPPRDFNRGRMYHDVQWTPEQVGRLWGYYGTSPAHAAMYFSLIFGADILNSVRSLGVLLDGANIVDFGCGPGHLLEHLLKNYRPKSAWGVEFSENSAQSATERVRRFEQFRGVVAAKQLPVDLPDACCDVLFLVEVVEHLDDETLNGTVAEARRLLRPNGHLIVTTPNAERLEISKTACLECGCIFHIWQHVRSWTPESLRTFAEKAGMTTVVSASTVWYRSGATGPIDRIRRIRDALRRRIIGPHGPFLFYVGQRR
jgi:SAM-dependent methyltransferase